MKNEKKKAARSRVYVSVLLAMVALVAVTAATVAWFSIADWTKVRSMSLDVVTDVQLRMDLDPHETIDQYVKTLSFEQIAQRIQQEKGFSMESTPLQPVTTSDQERFTFENDSVAEPTSGAYLEFTLHFMAEKDMIVHLNSANSNAGTQDGTAVSSGVASLPESMRISFSTDGRTWIYDPGMGDAASSTGTVKTFGLPGANNMVFNQNNAMFSMTEGVDKEVRVHIWMEGTDPACTDLLKAADYAIRMRFTGTDENGTAFSEDNE